MLLSLSFSNTLYAGNTNKSAGANPMVVMSTNHGDITIELFSDKAPISTENFLSYVKSDFFADTIFHRVIPDFMIQGGGFDKDMNQKTPNDTIKNEADNGLKNERGTLSMARTNVVDSATSQFFINLKDNDFLNNSSRDFGYAVFAKVVEGMDIVDKIAKVDTDNSGMHQNVPTDPIVITSVKIKEGE
jgi:peptidyl-prolyl cis-trans isomerase A (cyclophilin A)